MPGEFKRRGRPPKVTAEMLAQVAKTLGEVTVSELKRAAKLRYGHEGSATLVVEVARAEKLRRGALGSTAVDLLRASISNADVRTSFLSRIEPYPETKSGRIPEPLSEAAIRIGESVRHQLLRAMDMAHREFIDRITAERDRHRRELETARQLIVDLRSELDAVRASSSKWSNAVAEGSGARKNDLPYGTVQCRCRSAPSAELVEYASGTADGRRGERWRHPHETSNRGRQQKPKRGSRKSGRRRRR